MNYYRYEELFIGQSQDFSVTITEEMMSSFRTITGDINPLHNDDCFAKEHHYPQKVVFGMLTASFLSTFAGVYLPGECCLIQSVEAKFLNPVYIGDKLNISGTIVELNDCVKQIVLKVIIKNQDDIKILRSIVKVGVLEQ